MKKIFNFLTLCSIGILGLTTDASARTACAGITCNCCTPGRTCGVFYSQGGLPTGCSNGKQCGDTSGGTMEALSRDSSWLCTSASSGYRLTSGCAPQKCPTGCSECCTSASGAAVCTSCSSGYVSSGDECVSSGTGSGTVTGGGSSLPSTKCDITETVYTTKAKCLSGCGTTTCTNCLDRETMTSAWQCGSRLLITGECNISNCETCNLKGTSCTKCNAGYYLSSGSCVACPAGTISSAGATECTPCAVGTYASGTGNTLCRACEAGYYAGNTGSSSCTLCRANTYSNARASTCSACGSGKYSAFGSSSCSNCPGNCKTCSNGTSCSECESGYVWSSTQGQCLNASLCSEVCVAGSGYQGGFNNAIKMICEYCPTVENGYCTGCPSADCIKPSTCPAGRVTCKPGYHRNASTCVACERGSYQADDNTSRTDCMLCETGKYTAGTGSTSCTSCNTLFPVTGGTCTKCDSSGCTAATCPTGSVLDTASQACVTSSCNPGEYMVNGVCTMCPAGSYCTGEATATPCAPGTYSTRGSSVCSKCMPGKYQTESGKTTCDSCPPGTYSSEYGSTACTTCGPGTYSNGGSFQCTACTLHYYATGSGNSSCSACSDGTIPSSDHSICEPCPAGKFCTSTYVGPQDCPSATYSMGGAAGCASCNKIPIENGTCNSCTKTGECIGMTCNSGYKYSAEEDRCVDEKALCNKYYGISNGKCTQCIDAAECTDAICDSSALYYSQEEHACICPNGMKYNTSTKKCEEPECPLGQGFSLSAKACKSCSDLYPIANGTCSECNSSTCLASGITCSEGYKFTAGVCKAISEIFPIPNGICVKAGDTECSEAICDSEDLKFAGQIDWPLGCVCKDSKLVYEKKSGKCILDTCPAGTYKDAEANECKACSTINIGDGTCTSCKEGGICTEFSCSSNAVLNVNKCETCGTNTMKRENRCCSTLPPPGWGTTWVCDPEKDVQWLSGPVGSPEWNAAVNCEYGSIEAYAPADPMEMCTRKSCSDVAVVGGNCRDCDSKLGICTAIECYSGYRVAEKADGWQDGTSRYCIEDFASTAVKFCLSPLHYVAEHEACER